MANLSLIVSTILYFFLMGYVVFRQLPCWIRPEVSALLLSPLLGFGVLCVPAAYVVRFAPSIQWLTNVGFLVAAAGLVWFVWDVYRREIKLPRTFPEWVELGVGLCVVVLVVYLGTNDEGVPSSVYMNGIDVAGYSATAEYLRTWSGYAALENTLRELTGIQNITDAKLAVDSSFNTQTLIACEFILRAYRWSYSAILASTANIFAADTVYRFHYIFLAMGAGALFAATSFFVRRLTAHAWWPVVAGVAVAFNCNFLNVILQGQFAQVMAAALFLLLLVLVFQFRESLSLERREFAFYAFVVAVFMSLYSEMVFTFVVFMCLLGGLDIVTGEWKKIVPTLRKLLPPLFLGMLIALPITFTWLGFMKKHLKNVRVGGWPQPFWSTPAELLGLSNIYDGKFVVYEVVRHFVPSIWVFFLTFLIVPLGFFLLRSVGRPVRNFFIAGLLFIGAIFMKTYFIEGIHSYQYLKSYTFFLPLMVCAFFGLLWLRGRDIQAQNSKRIQRTLVGGLTAALILFSGAQYYVQARGSSQRISESMISMKNRQSFFLEHPVWFYPNHIFVYMLAGVAPIHWLNSGQKKFVAPLKDAPIALVIHRHLAKDWEQKPFAKEWPKLFEEGDFIVYQTPYTPAQLALEGVFSFEVPGPRLPEFVDKL